MSDGRDDSTKWLDRTPFRVRCTSFHIHSPLLIFFLCFIVLFQSCCSHSQVFGKTPLHEFSILYSHTEWNLFSSGTNTLLWWRAWYQKLNKLPDRLSWVTDLTGQDKVTGPDFFFSCPLYFLHSFSSSYLEFLPRFHCPISMLLSPCVGVWENTRAWVHHFQ